ncbi:MAG: hypothetical protein KF753_10265 [Caldilineaceae bacterium]|nr:hypothetical protein [Caldilineaceae bacterium]
MRTTLYKLLGLVLIVLCIVGLAGSRATAAPLNAATRIRFAPDTTSAFVDGQLQAGESKSFVVGAGYNQPMLVSVSGTQPDITLAITGARDGKVLLSANAASEMWSGLLPSSQDYILTVRGGHAASTFRLGVDIARRITFAPGATSAQYTGNLQAGETKLFVVRASKNQPMWVDVGTPDRSAGLTIYGFQDGQPLVRVVSGASSWQGLLPATQDYIIEAVADPYKAANLTLSVEIGARIAFQPGATSATVNGSASGGPVGTYVLRALAGQTMTAALTSPDKSVILVIYGFQDGSPLLTDHAGATTFTGKLPATQDYIIKAVKTGTPVNFSLTVKVK